MKYRLIFLQRFLFLQIVLFVSTLLYAQHSFPIYQPLSSYVEANLQNRDPTPSLTQLNAMYKQLDAKQQQAFLDSIYSGFKQSVEETRSKECQAFIDLYKFFAEPNDKKMPEICFVQGRLAAEVTRDSFALKNSINDLLFFDKNLFPEVSNYILTLQEYLKKARNYRSLLQDADGIWVCDNNLTLKVDGRPYLILKIENIGHKIQLIDTSFPIFRNWLKDDAKIATKTIDYGESAYVCWTSENLKVTDEMWVRTAYDFGGVASNAVATMVTGNSTSWGDVLRGNLTGGLVNVGFDLLFGSMFTPKKYMCIMECRLNRINEVSMSAHVRIQYIKAVAGEQPKTDIVERDFMFYKYNPEKKVLFIDAEGVDNHLTYADLYKLQRKEKKVAKKKYENVIRYVSSSSDVKRRARAKSFNFQQINKVIYFACQELCEKQGTTQSDKRATLGCVLEDLKMYPKVEKSARHGVYVKRLADCSYAYALKKGDVIQSVDGFEVNSSQELNDLISSMNPFDIVHLQVLRGKKIKEMDVELYYYVNH